MTPIKIEVVEPIQGEDDYKKWYVKNRILANILLWLTENMNEDGCVVVKDDDEMTRKLNMRFTSPEEYAFRRMDH